MYNSLRRRIACSASLKMPDFAGFHVGVLCNSSNRRFEDSDRVVQDPVPSFIREEVEREKNQPFSEATKESMFSRIVEAMDMKRRDGPPDRLGWSLDTFSLPNIIRFLNKKSVEFEIFQQRYIPQRNQQLGNEIGAAHFIVFRGGSVKFYGKKEWIKDKKDKSGDYDAELPKKFMSHIYLEAIDLSNFNMNLRYEGLENFENLSKLKWASFKNCKHFDDWCLDRISRQFRNSLEYLDISGCSKVTYRGLSALCKLNKLSVLVVHDIADSYEFQLSCLMLQDVFPNLRIEGVSYIELDANNLGGTKLDNFEVKTSNVSIS